jgi:pilus assembly protein CpaE
MGGADDVIDRQATPAQFLQALRRVSAIRRAEALDPNEEGRSPDPGGGVEPRAAGPHGPGLLVSVFSTRAGTGKTFVACTLAVLLADRSGESVAVADLDLRLGDVLTRFSEEPVDPLERGGVRPPSPDPGSVFERAVAVAPGVWGYAAASDAVARRAGDLFLRDLHQLRDRYLAVVADLPPGQPAPHVETALRASDVIGVVGSSDAVGLLRLGEALAAARSLGVDDARLLVVLNRVGADDEIPVGRVEDLLGAAVAARIPASRTLPTPFEFGVPLAQSASATETILPLAALADRLLAGAPVRRRRDSTA